MNKRIFRRRTERTNHEDREADVLQEQVKPGTQMLLGLSTSSFFSFAFLLPLPSPVPPSLPSLLPPSLPSFLSFAYTLQAPSTLLVSFSPLVGDVSGKDSCVSCSLGMVQRGIVRARKLPQGIYASEMCDLKSQELLYPRKRRQD